MNLATAKTIVRNLIKGNLEGDNTTDFARNIVPHLVSDPGIGKTSIVKQICTEEGYHLIEVVLPQYDPAELSGFPMLDMENKLYERARPFWWSFPTDKPTVIFFDEISQGTTPHHNVVAKLINERNLGPDRVLPDNVVIVTSGNKMSNRAGTQPMPSHLKDRLTFLEIEADIETFLDHAFKLEMDHRITGFLRHRPDFLAMFDAAADACPSPRSWMRVDTILSYNIGRLEEMLTVAGQIGNGAQADFLGYLEVASDMPDPEEVLKDPMGAKVPEDPAVLYATCAALSSYVTKSTAANLCKYVDRFKNKEFSAFCIRDALKRTPDLKKEKAVTQWFLNSGRELLL